MNGLEKLSPSQDGLPRPDHARPSSTTRSKLIEKHHGVTLDLEDLPARRPGHLRTIFSKGYTSGVFQFESRRHARHSAPLPARPHRGPDRAQRALPPRPHPGRHDRRLHRPQARPQAGRLRSARAEGDPRRDLRRHGLPGTGDADLQPPRRLLARRSRPAAPRHGQEEGRGDGQAARALRRRRASNAASPQKKAEQDLRPDGEVRRLRLQQVALGRLRLPRLRHRLSEGALSPSSSCPRC